jgi:hypothetical protein
MIDCTPVSFVWKEMAMTTAVAAPVGRGIASSRAFAESGVVSRPQQHWGERVLALFLASVAMVLNATLVGALVGVPLFLVALCSTG